jgi:hypothetical protein
MLDEKLETISTESFFFFSSLSSLFCAWGCCCTGYRVRELAHSLEAGPWLQPAYIMFRYELFGVD